MVPKHSDLNLSDEPELDNKKILKFRIDDLLCKVLKESPGGTLVKLGHGVPQHPEDDSLGRGEHQRQQPGHDHHQPE